MAYDILFENISDQACAASVLLLLPLRMLTQCAIPPFVSSRSTLPLQCSLGVPAYQCTASVKSSLHGV